MKKITLKRYLIKEGGKATDEWKTARAFPKDIKVALHSIAKALGVEVKQLSNNLLGTSRLTYQNKKSSSGDIDIAVDEKNFSEYHKKTLQLVDNRGLYNTGIKVGSYAVDVGNGKLVQVDLMFVKSEELAKFTYYSSEGENSKYPGAVRNIMLMTLATFMLEDGKDFVIKHEDEIIARASRSLKLDKGLERLFKVAKMRKDGEGRTKSLEKVSPEELEHELKTIDSSKVGKFDKSPDIIDNPDEIASFFFGKNVKAKDILTAENVAKQINKTFSGEKLHEIKEKIKMQLGTSGFEVPTEF